MKRHTAKLLVARQANFGQLLVARQEVVAPGIRLYETLYHETRETHVWHVLGHFRVKHTNKRFEFSVDWLYCLL